MELPGHDVTETKILPHHFSHNLPTYIDVEVLLDLRTYHRYILDETSLILDRLHSGDDDRLLLSYLLLSLLLLPQLLRLLLGLADEVTHELRRHSILLGYVSLWLVFLQVRLHDTFLLLDGEFLPVSWSILSTWPRFPLRPHLYLLLGEALWIHRCHRELQSTPSSRLACYLMVLLNIGVSFFILHGVNFVLDSSSYVGGHDTLLSQILLIQLELLLLWCWIISSKHGGVEDKVVSIGGVLLLHSLDDLLAINDVRC